MYFGEQEPEVLNPGDEEGFAPEEEGGYYFLFLFNLLDYCNPKSESMTKVIDYVLSKAAKPACSLL